MHSDFTREIPGISARNVRLLIPDTTAIARYADLRDSP